MSKLPLVLRELHRAETDLARDLLALADRHRAEHEIFHVARDIATWSQIHVRRLAEIAPDYGASLNPTPRWTRPRPLPDIVRGLAARLRRRPEPGLLLLADLRHVHRTAAGVSLDWELLAQAAQGMKQRPLLELAQDCHPQTLRQMPGRTPSSRRTRPRSSPPKQGRCAGRSPAVLSVVLSGG